MLALTAVNRIKVSIVTDKPVYILVQLIVLIQQVLVSLRKIALPETS